MKVTSLAMISTESVKNRPIVTPERRRVLLDTKASIERRLCRRKPHSQFMFRMFAVARRLAISFPTPGKPATLAAARPAPALSIVVRSFAFKAAPASAAFAASGVSDTNCHGTLRMSFINLRFLQPRYVRQSTAPRPRAVRKSLAWLKCRQPRNPR